MHGEPGIGKTALLEYATAGAQGFQVLRTVGNEAEMALPFAALHQFCSPCLASLEQLPEPQRDALQVAFGLDHRRRAGPVARRVGGAEPVVAVRDRTTAACASSTTRSGSIANRRRRSRSSRAGW